MSKWADEKDGKVILSIADLRESPGEDECRRCEYFEMEDGNIE